MRRLICLMIIAGPLMVFGQITTPAVKARFGVDADLRANFFNGLSQTGNDDWYNLLSADTSGKAVIDTTGCAAIVAGYIADVSPYPKRMATLYRTMNRPSFSIVNNRLWLDALWIRDYHGTDTTVFTSGSDKNGMSPADWTGGIQGIPDKNDILDIFVHLRRAGPNTVDSLWLFGGISVDNTTGNRYFDFEMWQTDIYYDRPSGKWYGYGPDAGHTAWTFDASGNITKPGDIIFSAEYQSSTLSNIEARVWVSRAVWQTVTPTAFSWGGLFDGATASSAYGYASIAPKTAGAFYTGLGSAVNAWPGPFRLILQNNALTNAYAKDQFMEFSVNLSKLGLDPVTQIGGDICGTPFNRIVVKTRASASFTSELKDFVAPTDFFLAPRAQIATTTPQICDTGSYANIYVVNPVVTSVYQWSTPNGHIVGPTTGPSIFVDTPGIYIVKQYLQAGCSMYASDTITITPIANCVPLENNLHALNGYLRQEQSFLEWQVLNNYVVSYFEIRRSEDGTNFTTVGRVNALTLHDPAATYSYDELLTGYGLPYVYYQVKMVDVNGRPSYSNIVRLQLKDPAVDHVQFIPNPVKNNLSIEINCSNAGPIEVILTDMSGKTVVAYRQQLSRGYNSLRIADLSSQPAGVYQAQVLFQGKRSTERIVVLH